ncbi:hypothetical protein BC830DRAFT_1172501 [Chytriomyces sp. MP71]|nr:hypothetical protein BC830DRAFT_1172501 [Chytriomyces sp. MP71]
MSTFFDQLQVSTNADSDTIKKKYVRLGYDIDDHSSVAFKQLAIAYLVLASDRSSYLKSLSSNATYIPPQSILKQDPAEVYKDCFNEIAEHVPPLTPESGASRSAQTSMGYTFAGAVSGVTLGFITAGPIGAVLGGAFGIGAGHVRDVHKKSAFDVFMSLEHEERKKIIDKVTFVSMFAVNAVVSAGASGALTL